MVDNRKLFSIVDELSPVDLEALYQHIRQRRQVVTFHSMGEPHLAAPTITAHEPADTIREEVNAVIDEAISQTKRKRETHELEQVKAEQTH